jgi:hypothetical protein
MGNEAKQQAIMDTSSSALACNGTDGDGDNHSAQKLNGIELSNQTEDGHQSSHEMTAVATKVESMDDNACDEVCWLNIS